MTFVPPTQYKLSRTKQQPSGFSPLKLIPSFEVMDLNRTTSSSQTRYGCSACPIHLFQGRACWGEHIWRSKLADLVVVMKMVFFDGNPAKHPATH